MEGQHKQQEKRILSSLYDTTLRDGTQRKGFFGVCRSKTSLKIANLLDKSASPISKGAGQAPTPKDMEFFKRLKANPLKRATVVHLQHQASRYQSGR